MTEVTKYIVLLCRLSSSNKHTVLEVETDISEERTACIFMYEGNRVIRS